MRLLTIHKEVLGSSSRLSDDVGNMEGVLGDVNTLPGFSIIPSELDLISFLFKSRRDNQSSMVSDIIDVVSCVRRCPRYSTVTRDVQVLSLRVG